MVTVTNTSALLMEGSRTARFEGEPHGSGVSFFLVDNDPGQGPLLHKHPYTETWVVLSGQAVITTDGQDIEAGKGDIVVVGPETPHKFRNTGSGPLELVCVHASPRFIQDNLEDEDGAAPA